MKDGVADEVILNEVEHFFEKVVVILSVEWKVRFEFCYPYRL